MSLLSAERGTAGSCAGISWAPLGPGGPRVLSRSQQDDCPLVPPLPLAAQAINYTAHLMQPVVQRCKLPLPSASQG